MKEIINEIKLLHKVSFHANIIQFFGVTEKKGNEDNMDSNYLLILERANNESPIPNTPINYIDVYTKCWQSNPNDRPDMQQVFSNLKSINVNTNEIKVLEFYKESAEKVE
ncbi:unnamed protein product [Rhizophagus irregularis]|nr:unnamed protein product [Rhizophagus irregularis]